jgi:hypothetical protein
VTCTSEPTGDFAVAASGVEMVRELGLSRLCPISITSSRQRKGGLHNR